MRRVTQQERSADLASPSVSRQSPRRVNGNARTQPASTGRLFKKPAACPSPATVQPGAEAPIIGSRMSVAAEARPPPQPEAAGRPSLSAGPAAAAEEPAEAAPPAAAPQPAAGALQAAQQGSGAAEDDDVIVLVSDDEQPAQRQRGAGGGQGAGPSRPAAAQQQRRRPRSAGGPSSAARGAAQADAEIIDLTSDSPPSEDIQIVHSTVAPVRSGGPQRGPMRGAKRPRISAPAAVGAGAGIAAGVQPPAAALAHLSPAKQRLVAQLLNPPAAAAPEPEREGPKCGICLEPMGGSTDRPMASGSCGHVYCYDCLVGAVKAQKKCPTCRKSMQVRQVHKVFLDYN